MLTRRVECTYFKHLPRFEFGAVVLFTRFGAASLAYGGGRARVAFDVLPVVASHNLADVLTTNTETFGQVLLRVVAGKVKAAHLAHIIGG